MTEGKINHYARHRTILANERTILSYIRTALTLFVAGVSFIRFFGIAALSATGYAFVVASIVLIIVGALRFRKMDAHIKDVKK